ncbi:MAG: hypothetical protein HN948_07570 [Clostridia bacterium]|nr:hypothetical protein [Clostridia bacterium]MBT7122853.1 hypothetical protein [Clostridia bacterium]
MKQAVVFYSRDGSTKVFAQAIADKFDADVYELKEVTPIKGFMSAAWGAMSGKRSELTNDFADDMVDYDKIYAGTPVWGGKAVPAVNMFFDKAQIEGKQIVFFTVQGGKTNGKPISGAKRMVKDIEAKGAKTASAVSFTGGSKKKPASKQSANEQVKARL